MGGDDNLSRFPAVDGTGRHDRPLDALRALATIRVVVYHATGDPAWTWLAALPVMIFVSGALAASSIDHRGAANVVRSRLRRLMPPFWAWGAFVAVVYTATGAWGRVPWWGIPGFVAPLVPPAGAGAGLAEPSTDPLYWTYMALWYVTVFVVFLLIGLLLRRPMRRAPVATIALLLAPVVLSEIIGSPLVGAPTCLLVFWALGDAYHHRRDALPPAPLLLAIACSALGVAVSLVAIQPAGLRLGLDASPLVLVALGTALVCCALGLRSPIERITRTGPARSVVGWLSARSLTIFLWHPLAIAVVARSTLDAHGTTVSVAAVIVATFAIACVVGWIEDVAAGRPVEIIPSG